MTPNDHEHWQRASAAEQGREVPFRLRVNGVGVGFDAAARTEIVADKVLAHEVKLKVLEKLTPELGLQTAELLGRFTLLASAAFNHVARGCEPSITRGPLEHASEMQAQLFRGITATDPTEIRDVQHDANPAGPTERRCEELMHLSQKHGGFGWAHPRLVKSGAEKKLYKVSLWPRKSARPPLAK